MFGRRPSPDSDSVALARRRLAVLAAQFEASAAGRAEAMSDAALPQSSPGNPGSLAASGLQPRPRRGASAVEEEEDAWDDGGEYGEGDVADDRDVEPGQGRREPKRVGSSLRTPGRHATRAPGREYGRWSLDMHHITVLALVLAAVVAVAAWFVLKATPQAKPVQLTNERSVPSTATTPEVTSSPGASPAQTPVGGPSVPSAASGSTAAMVVVDVTGKVRKPGIVELPAGSRVVDALTAAGGARRGVRTNSLNLARPLVDGEQIVVGVRVPRVDLVPSVAGSGGSTPSGIAQVNLNTATQEQLETLPGIGPVTAAAILQWRTENGGFTSVDQLLDVSGIGDITLANIEAYVHV